MADTLTFEEAQEAQEPESLSFEEAQEQPTDQELRETMGGDTPEFPIPRGPEELAAQTQRRNIIAAPLMPKPTGRVTLPTPETPWYQKSVLGESGWEVPSGAGTTIPAVTVPLSAAGQLASGIGHYLTSPQGMAEVGLAATPAAPAVFIKWASDMLHGAGMSIADAKEAITKVVNDRFSQGIINAGHFGMQPAETPEGEQEQIQKIVNDIVNVAALGMGGVGAAKTGIRGVAKLARESVAPKVLPDVVQVSPGKFEAIGPMGFRVRPSMPEVLPVTPPPPGMAPSVERPEEAVSREAPAPATAPLPVSPVRTPEGYQLPIPRGATPEEVAAMRRGELPPVRVAGAARVPRAAPIPEAGAIPEAASIPEAGRILPPGVSSLPAEALAAVRAQTAIEGEPTTKLSPEAEAAIPEAALARLQRKVKKVLKTPADAGKKAAAGGQSLVDNPYVEGSSEASAWEAGFKAVSPKPSPVVRAVPPGSIPPESVVPAIRLIGGEVVEGKPGETHPDIIARRGIKAEDIDQRGFWNGKDFLDREATAQGTGLPTEREPGRQHSTDLPAAKAEAASDELESAAQDLYGTPYDELSRYEQSQVRATLEHKAPEILEAPEAPKAKPTLTPPAEPAPAKEPWQMPKHIGRLQSESEPEPAKPAEAPPAAPAPKAAAATPDRFSPLTQPEVEALGGVGQVGERPLPHQVEALEKLGLRKKPSESAVAKSPEVIAAEDAAQAAFEKLGAAEKGAYDKSKRKGMTKPMLAKLAAFDKLVEAEKQAKAADKPAAPKAAPASLVEADLFPDLKGKAPTLERVRRAIQDEEANYERLYEKANEPNRESTDPVHEQVDLSERKLKRLRALGGRLEESAVREAKGLPEPEPAPQKPTQESLEPSVREQIRKAPSYQKLLAAYRRFSVSLYGKDSPHIAARMAEVEASPEDLLTAHSGVMNAKSQTANTLRALADAVFKETGLPRRPQGKFRGMDSIDWDKLTESKGEPLSESARPEGIVENPMPQADVEAWLRERHGVDPGKGVVNIVHDTAPDAPKGAFIRDRETGEIIGIRLNRAKIGDAGTLSDVWNEEVAHWFDRENPDAAERLLKAINPEERAAIDTRIKGLGYATEKYDVEARAAAINKLAESWHDRGWFGRLIGDVMRFANEKLKVPLTRRAAESLAVRALARTVQRVREFQPNRINQILRMSPSELAVWKRDNQYGPELMRQLAGEVTPEQLPALQRQRDIYREGVRRGLETARNLPPEQREAVVNDLMRSDLVSQTLNELVENARPRAVAAEEARVPAGITQAAKDAADYVKTLVKEEFNAPKMTDLRRSVLNWSAKLQRSFGEAAAKQRDIIKRVRDPIRRDGITNWIQADGDKAVLAKRLADTEAWANPNTGEPHPDAKRLADGYRAALALTPEEIAVANQVKADYAAFGARGHAADVLNTFKDNYVTQIWNLGKGPSGGASGRTLKQRFRFSKASTFPTFFDGEQAGYSPKTKDIAKLLPIYSHEMNSVIAAREMVKQMGGDPKNKIPPGKASDGRPLLAPKGIAVPVEGEEGQATLVMPKVPKEGFEDYKELPNQPALTKWKWVSEDSAGNPIYLKAELALHPEAYAKLNAALGRSAIREWYGTKTTVIAEIPKALVRGIDFANSETKRTMLGLLATFHQVQTGTHAIGHRVNPFFSIPKIDLVGNAAQMDAAKHGLMLLPDRASENQFMEGFRSSGLVSRIKWVGPAADFYSRYLFTEYIPGLKYKTYEAILNRNQKIYAGRASLSDVKLLSAEQANAAYGHLNYADLGRNPTIQHIAQLFALAPDFLEARMRFAGQAIKGITGAKAGREQLLALGTLAIAQAAGAFTAAKITGGEWDKKQPFEFTLGNRRYTLRSVPEDTYQLLTRTRQFAHNRLSPIIGKGALQYATGVDYRGQKVTAGQTTKELLMQPIPLTARGFLGTSKSSLSAWEQLAGSVGLKISRYSPAMDVYDMARDWKRNNPNPKIRADFERTEKSTFPTSAYKPLREALAGGNMGEAQKEYRKLLQVRSADAIAAQMDREAPFTGSEDNETAFKKSLTPDQRRVYDRAKADRTRIHQRFLRLGKERVAPTPESATFEELQ